MNRKATQLLFLIITVSFVAAGQPQFQSDVIAATGGDITMTFLGHGSVMLAQAGKTVYVDPVRRYADFTQLPKADLILITHEHGDHLDSAAIAALRKETTAILLTERCSRFVPGSSVMKNGESRSILEFAIEAVPAYNIVHMRSADNPFHPKGSGNGYIVTIGGVRIYFAGDTENIPEMSDFGIINYAFLPMNLPYTMTPDMVAEAAKRIKPNVLYPYHFGNTDTSKLVELLTDEKTIEVRIRNLK